MLPRGADAVVDDRTYQQVVATETEQTRSRCDSKTEMIEVMKPAAPGEM